MKTLTLMLAIFLAISLNSIGQTGWTMVNSGLDAGQGVGQISIGMNDNTALWGLAINDDGSVFDAFTRSIDGGNTWEAGTFNAGNSLSQLFAIDANTCWAVFNTGADQGLYKTEDGGITWVKKGGVYGASSFANVIHFFNDMDGFAQGDPVGTDYELYTTDDGGETWTAVDGANIPDPTSGEFGITGNYYAVGDNIWWGTNQGRIFRSTDKGYTWEAALTAFGATETVGILMFDADNGISFRSYLNMGIEPTLNETSDGGATWTAFNTVGASFARFFFHVPGTVNTVYGSAHDAVAGMGISISYDGGHNWTELNSGYAFMASAWLDEETGWCGTFSTGSGNDGMYIHGNALIPLYEDDFESYTSGEYLAVQNPDWWTTWNNAPGGEEDALIVDEQAHSGSQSVKVEGLTDLILKLGNKTSGKYEIKFYYYLPAGFCGYFNIQHFESPGIEWAYEVHFGATGSGYLSAGSEQVAGFNYTPDTWIEIDNIIDLTNDWTELYIDGELLYEWPFSWQYNAQTGTNQLGAMDVWAGGPTGETPLFYMDDVELIQLEGGIGAPVIGLDPTIMIETINAGTTTSQTLSISNTGELDLEYGIVVTYPDDNKSAKAISPSTGNTKVVLSSISEDPTPNPGGSPDPTDDVVLNYDGENASAIGLTTGGAMRCAAVFTPNEVGDYIGMELSEIEVFINEAPIATKAQVYNYGLTSLPGPGELILEQDWNFTATNWNTVSLNDPVIISGGDIWVGYWIDHAAGTFPAGTDGGPHHPNGDWISSGPGWHHLSDNVALDYNWNIRAVLTGDPIIQWLSVSSTSGTVAVGATEDIDVNFDATELEIGAYYAELVVNSNDPENPQSTVNVNLGVLTGINEFEKTAVMLYPNPAVNFFNIKSDHEILTVELMNLMGQRILIEEVNAETHQINTSELQTGIYIIKVDTENGAYSSRIAID